MLEIILRRVYKFLIILLYQVFDSGSSCSNEECWGLDDKGEKVGRLF
jgi:hypothetical protein